MEEYGAKVLIGKILNKPLRVTAKIANVDYVRHIGSFANTELFRVNSSILFSTTGKGGTIWVSDGELADQDVELVEEYILGNVEKDYLEEVGIDSLDAADVEFLLAAAVSRFNNRRQ